MNSLNILLEGDIKIGDLLTLPEDMLLITNRKDMLMIIVDEPILKNTRKTQLLQNSLMSKSTEDLHCRA